MCPPPPLLPEGEEEDKGGGEEAQGNLIREKKEGGIQIQVDPKPNFYGNQQKSFISGRNNTQGKLTAKKMTALHPHSLRRYDRNDSEASQWLQFGVL